MQYNEQLILFLIALAANWLSALSGGGAGLIQLPVLIFLGLPFSIALATHKIATVALGLGATARHARDASRQWRMTAAVTVVGLPAVILGALGILHVPARAAEIGLGALTLALSVYSMRQTALGLHVAPKHRDAQGYVMGALVLALIGFINGGLSAGSGLFVTLWLVRWFGLDYRQAVAHTMISVGLVWNATGAIVMGTVGQVQWSWLPALLLGSLIGGYLGANTSLRISNQHIKRVYECLTLLVAIKLLWG